MQIKIVILSKHEKYVERLCAYIREHYPDSFQFIPATIKDNALKLAQDNRADFFLTDDGQEIQLSELPKRCQIVLLTESKNISKIGNYDAVYMYQAIPVICDSLKNIYATILEREKVELKSISDGYKKIITFLPGAGGVGCSTAAAACARILAKKRQNVLYLNLEQYGSADLYFNGQGGFDFGDIIYALARDNGTVQVRLDSAMRRDDGGVYFISGCRQVLDMADMNAGYLEELFKAIGGIKRIDWVIVDMDFDFSERVFQQINRSHAVVIVTDGRQTSDLKTRRVLQGLQLYADKQPKFPLNRICLLYNRVGSDSGCRIRDMSFKIVGEINRVANAEVNEIVQWIADQRDAAFLDIFKM